MSNDQTDGGEKQSGSRENNRGDGVERSMILCSESSNRFDGAGHGGTGSLRPSRPSRPEEGWAETVSQQKQVPSDDKVHILQWHPGSGDDIW